VTAPGGATVTVTVPLTSFSGWTAAMSAEVIGVQWQVMSPPTPRACAPDFRIDDVKFVP
jgi:hypothetical protein